MKTLFAVATVVGAVVPYLFFISHFQSEGMALDGFVAALFSNGAAGGFSADLLITSAVFWTYLWYTGVEKLWLYVLLNLTIGLSCAFPLYLYLNYDKLQPRTTA